MTETRGTVNSLLVDAEYRIGDLALSDLDATTFENDSVMGFVIYFPNASKLIENWQAASTRVLENLRLVLRSAGDKAWNLYVVLLADEPGTFGQRIALCDIEENLVGTRKIARAGVADSDSLRNALLPLLHLQSPPKLEAVDMAGEIESRTTELPRGLMHAFLSDSSEDTLVQLLEDS